MKKGAKCMRNIKLSVQNSKLLVTWKDFRNYHVILVLHV